MHDDNAHYLLAMEGISEAKSSKVTPELYQKGLECLKEAASILICNWSDLNYAIEEGLSSKNKKLSNDQEKEITALREIVGYLKAERKSDSALRSEIILTLVDLSKYT